jgi:hypothetical protein
MRLSERRRPERNEARRKKEQGLGGKETAQKMREIFDTYTHGISSNTWQYYLRNNQANLFQLLLIVMLLVAMCS